MKKTWKGWIRNDENPRKLFVWEKFYNDQDYRELEFDIKPCDRKGRKPDWDKWPPRRVTITVEWNEE